MKRNVKSLIKVTKPMLPFHVAGLLLLGFCLWFGDDLLSSVAVAAVFYLCIANLIPMVLMFKENLRTYEFPTKQIGDIRALYDFMNKESLYQDILPVSCDESAGQIIYAPHSKIQHTLYIDQKAGTFKVGTDNTGLFSRTPARQYKYARTSGRYLAELAITCNKAIAVTPSCPTDPSEADI